MLTPAFHFDILDKSLVIMMKHTNVGLDLFTASAEKGDFVDIWEAMSMLGWSPNSSCMGFLWLHVSNLGSFMLY